jgi:hypothetical protein
LLVVNLISAGMVWLLARRLLGTRIAAAATAIYALLSVSQSVLGIFAHATHFVILFALAGFLLLMRHLDDRRMWPLTLSGVCFGFATTMKQHAVLLGIFAFLYLLRAAFRRGDSFRLLVGECSVFLFGAAAPIAAIFAWMIKAGIFERFWFWTVFYPTHYVSEVPIITGIFVLIFQTFIVISYQSLIWLAALLGYILLRRRIDRADLLFIYGFLFSAFLAMSPGLYFRPHYFVLILVPISLLASYFVVESQKLNWSMISESTRSFVPLLLLILLTGVSLYSERYYLFLLPPNEVSRSTYKENPFPESVAVANYIREHSLPNDKIAVLGSEPQIYFYSDRLSVTSHIYMYNLTENGALAKRFRHELITDIESQQPLYIVKISYSASWFSNLEAMQKQYLEAWSDAYLNKYYRCVGLVNIYPNKSEYYWGINAVNEKSYSNSFVTLWRRKTTWPRVQDSLEPIRAH